MTNESGSSTMVYRMSPSKPVMTAEQFRKIFDKSGLSQVELAEKIGVNKQTVHRWLKGTRGIDQFKAAAIRTALK